MIIDHFRIDGKVAVITGGSKGIGGAMSIALAEAGADIAVVSRRPDDGIAESINKRGRRYVHIAADLTQRADTATVIHAACRALGTVDILVNNAGIIRRRSAAEYGSTDWDATVEIDLTAAFLLSRDAGRIMLNKGWGKIINVASVMAFQGGLNVVAYAASKHGIAGLTKALAVDWARHGVGVNAMAPSFFETEMTQALKSDPQRNQSITQRTPIGRWGQPEDIAGATVFLASPASDFIHGVVLPVDGGWMAG